VQARRVYQWGLFREICLKREPAWQALVGDVQMD